MSKRKNVKKEDLVVQKSNIFKDKKRRIHYIDEKGNTYRLYDGEERFLIAYGGRMIYAMIPLPFSFSFLEISIVYAFLISILIFGVFEGYYHLVMKRKLQPVKMPTEIETALNQPELFREKRFDTLLKLTMALLVLIILVIPTLTKNMNNQLTSLEMIVSSLAIALVTAFLVQQTRLYFKYHKASK